MNLRTGDRVRHYFNKFKKYVEDNVAREKYTYVALKPSTEIFYIVATSPESCKELHEQLGYFFHGFELAYLAIDQSGATNE